MENDEFTLFFENKKKLDIVTCTVSNTNINGIYVRVGNRNLTIFIKKKELATNVENQRPSRFVQGDALDAVITELSLKNRKVSLSIKKLEETETAETVKKYGSKDSGGVLGDILGAALNLTKKKKDKK